MKLKNTFLILFLCCTSLCFAQDKLFEKYADMVMLHPSSSPKKCST